MNMRNKEIGIVYEPLMKCQTFSEWESQIFVINLELVVLGGGIMAQKEYLKERLRKSLDKYLLPSIAEHTRLEFAENQNLAGMLGAFYHFKGRH